MSDLTDLTQQLQLKFAKTPCIAQWSSQLAEVALSFRVPQAALDFSLDLAAIIYQESLGGDVLKPKGANGTGDWSARSGSGHWAHAPNSKIVSILPAGWFHPRDSLGNIIPGPYVISIDELGFGRGLCQLDVLAHPELMVLGDDGVPLWANPMFNIKAGAKIYNDALTYFHGDKSKAFPSYNAGVGNVSKAISEGKPPDAFTSGHKYGALVFKHRAMWTV